MPRRTNRESYSGILRDSSETAEPRSLEDLAAELRLAESEVTTARIENERLDRDLDEAKSARESLEKELSDKENEIETLEVAIKFAIDFYEEMQAGREKIVDLVLKADLRWLMENLPWR